MENTTNEILTEVTENIDVAEELVEVGSEKGIGLGVAIGGAVVLLGGLAYKYAIKPIVAKIKAKKEQKADIELSEDDVEVIE